MGITGLIPFLEKASTTVNITQLQGSSVAVDSYCWLHKGVFACADKIIKGEETNIHIQYCLKYVDMLQRHKIRVIMVFDGRHLPAKAETERRRREARNESKKLAKEYLRMNEIEKAKSHMRRAVDVTHEMALRLIKACRDRGIDCIVAPYEADAQMAWLNKQGLAEYIVTEDSDLTLFGAKRILFKLDLTGQALLVESTKLYLAMGCRPEKYTFDKFRRMCILSGCDYLDSLQGIGLKKACKFILTTAEDDMTKALKKLPSYLKMKQLEVTDEYIESFLKADATFKHMYIYNPLERRMERLYQLEEFQTDESLCSNAGSLLDNSDQAFQLALGNLNPFTLKQLDDWHPKKNWSSKLKNESIWLQSREYTEKEEFSESKQLSNNQPSTSKSLFHFKKIEYKHIADTEIAQNLSVEKNKLEESEIFSMYKYASPEMQRKRKRLQSSSSSGEDEVSAEDIPKKSTHNPFAKVNTSAENIKKSPVCTNNSLLKLLSPKKINAAENVNQQHISMTKSIKSRFFVENIKQIVKKPFAARDLTNEMFNIEKKTKEYLQQQQVLYNYSPEKKQDICDNELSDSSQQSDENEINNCAEEDFAADTDINNVPQTTRITHCTNLKEEIILLSDTDEEQSFQKFSISSSLQKLSRTSQNSKLINSKTNIKKTQTAFSKSKKTTLIDDTKQSKLSMFGFQKRPSLKNS